MIQKFVNDTDRLHLRVDAMRCDLEVIFLTLISNVLTEQQPGICSHSSQGNPIECCKNYKLVGNTCTACTPGTFGENCEEECPKGLYGLFCKEICSCDPCDKVTGCSNTTEKCTCDSEANHDSTLLHYPSILISLIGTGAVCFTFCVAIMCIFRERKPAIGKCVVSTMHERDVAASQNVYDHLGKDSYNVLMLKASSSGIL